MRRRDLPGILVGSASGALLAGTHAGALPADRYERSHYPQSDAEHASEVVPTDDTHPPGSVLRYGADPSGKRDSAGAWRDAIRANSWVFDDHPGGGSYLFGSEVVIERSPITISGCAKGIGAGTGGTVLTLAQSAGAGAAVLRTTAWSSGVRIEKIRFAWQDTSAEQYGLRFAELRASKILDCAFVGKQRAGTKVVGMRCDGLGTFTGDVTVRGNYFSGLLRGVDLQGTCTSVRILENELYGYVSQARSCGIRATNHSIEPLIAFNMLEGWTTGIESSGAYIKQIANSYEANGTNFEWIRGAGNARIWNISIAETFLSGGQPLYPLNDTDLCMVLGGPGVASLDAMSVNARRGFFAYGRPTREGDWSVEPFSAGAFSANNAGGWEVAAAQQSALEYTRIGHTVIINFRVDSSSVSGKPSQLFIRLPPSVRAVRPAASTCYIQNGGGAIGKSWIAADASVLTIARAADEAFSSGPLVCWGSLTFECG